MMTVLMQMDTGVLVALATLGLSFVLSLGRLVVGVPQRQKARTERGTSC